MEPVKTEKLDGIYGAPRGLEKDIDGLPFYRERDEYFETTRVFSVWEPTPEERKAIAEGANILVAQLGEPIRPMLVRVTSLKRVEENAEAKAE